MEYNVRHWQTGKAVRIETENGKIAALIEIEDDPGLPFAGPPLLDMQVNGYAGRNINAAGETVPEDLLVITEKFRETGIALWVPTIVTNSKENILVLLENITKALNECPLVRRSVPGIHLEGPFISSEEGPRGAHPKEHVRPPSVEEYRTWQGAAEGMIRIVTCAAEYEESPGFIREIVKDGTVASLGHTDADRDQIKACVDAGASLATHLGNGAHPLVGRHENYIWELLAEDRVWAGIIGDGFHLPQAQLQNFIRAKTPERVVLTSDVIYLGGMDPGEYHFAGKDVVMRKDGKVVLASNPDLMAGASFHLLPGIEHAVSLAGRTREEAWRMASVNAASMMGLEHYPRLREGDDALLTCFRWDGEHLTDVAIVDERV